MHTVIDDEDQPEVSIQVEWERFGPDNRRQRNKTVGEQVR